MRSLIYKNPLRSAAGFTLIEMAIVVMILGLVIAAFTPLYHLHLENKAIETTQTNIDDITASMGSFRAVNGRYPCPASLTAQRGDANYGREDCTNYNGVINPGTCDDGAAGTGICREQSERVIPFMDPYTAGNPIINANPIVRVGAIPFRELNIDEDEAFDGYDNRIMYAVTENMMNDVTFRANEGGIEIVDNAAPPASILNPAASAHFLIFSYGKNANGAYTKIGQRNDCAPGGTETDNCDETVNSRYILTQHSSNNDGTQYDDVMTYFTQSEVPLWQLSTAQQGSIVQKPGGDVGMNFLTAATNFVGSASLASKQGQISGDLRADDDPADPAIIQGNIMSDSLCPSTGPGGGDCFNTEVLAGTVGAGGGMRCPDDDTFDDSNPPDGVVETGDYMVGVRNGAPICSDEAPIGCPPGEIMTGINPNGQIECAANSSCGAYDAPICSTTRQLTAGTDGATRTVTAPLTRIQQWRCENSSWVQLSEAGECSCTPRADQTRTNQACTTGFTGTFTQTRRWICPTAASPPGTMAYWTPWAPAATTSGNNVSYPPGTPCTCVGATQTRNSTCPANSVPTPPTQSRTFNCTGPQAGTWTAWAPPVTCTCVPQPPQVRWRDCGGNSPPGAQKQQTRTFVSCPNNWTDWADTDISACTCTPWSETRTGQPCPISGYIGSVTNRYDYACPSGVTVTQISSTCAPPPPIVCSWASSDFVGSSTTAAGPRIGTTGMPPCTCGDTRPQCHTGSTDNFQIYQNCVCGS